MLERLISLRGVETNNLKQIDLDLQWGKLIVLCGVSGSGKTSLALDTLYAEGQRRYIESFSAYARRFLDRLEKPPAERIEGIPPAVAVTRRPPPRDSRTTVGEAAEISDYLRVLFARVGNIVCPNCDLPVERSTAESAAASLGDVPADSRLQLAFTPRLHEQADAEGTIEQLVREGFTRFVVGGRTASRDEAAKSLADNESVLVIVDRLKGGADLGRLKESLETAFQFGAGACVALIETDAPSPNDQLIDDRPWRRIAFSKELQCGQCGRAFNEPEPNSFNFANALGACKTCEGEGVQFDFDFDLIAPNDSKSIAEGALEPFNDEATVAHQKEVIVAAAEKGVPADEPVASLSARQKAWLFLGDERFRGVKNLMREWEASTNKRKVDRYKNDLSCEACGGDRLRPESLAVRVGGLNFAQVANLTAARAERFLTELQLEDEAARTAQRLIDEAVSRLRFLNSVGLAYLSLDRLLHTLSGGESQRVALASALGSNLVNMLYVLDEPAAGLHPADGARMVEALRRLRDRGNTVLVVEHSPLLIQAADEVVEIGPGAGDAGGEVIFQGTPAELVQPDASRTGEYLAGRRGVSSPGNNRAKQRGSIRITGARGRNLKAVDVEFPLGRLCLVTGVSGAGKSTLVQDTLYPALCRHLRMEAAKPLPFNGLFGAGQIDHVALVDQSPIGKSPRSSPVTYIKAFDEIRRVFAESVDARARNYTAGHFSFNVDGGRCAACKGDGHIQVDMQFLADVYMKCPHCGGARYRSEILDVHYRGMSISDVLNMTIREAFSFFRGRSKVQSRLKQLIDVGLDYLRLGQGANTLSSGEAQRMKLAASLGGKGRQRTLFLLDEPTTGLHFADIVNLLDCFDALLSVGHSLILIEHNLQLMMAADHIIDLGPGSDQAGGSIVAQGSVQQIAAADTPTGRFLAEQLASQLS